MNATVRKIKRKRKPSMFTPYDNETIRLLGEGRSVKEIYRILFPNPNSGYSYQSFLVHINACGLRNATDNAGYEMVPKCVECKECVTVKRLGDAQDIMICLSEKKEIGKRKITSPRWCPKRDKKRQGEL